MEALQHGLHVLVEKPMTLNVADAVLLMRTAREAQRQAWVGFNRRFCRQNVTLREVLSTLHPQDIRAMHTEFLGGSGGWQAVTPTDDTTGADALEDIAPHQIDLLPWLVGRPVISARASPKSGRYRASTAVDYELRFDTGLIAHCRARHAPIFRESVSVRLQHRTLWADRAGVFQSRGLPQAWLRTCSELRTISESIVRRLLRRRSELEKSFERQLNAFAATIRNQPESVLAADAASGATGMQIIQACRESRANGGCWMPVGQSSEQAA
jgi:predicted dehydrogenase